MFQTRTIYFCFKQIMAFKSSKVAVHTEMFSKFPSFSLHYSKCLNKVLFPFFKSNGNVGNNPKRLPSIH